MRHSGTISWRSITNVKRIAGSGRDQTTSAVARQRHRREPNSASPRRSAVGPSLHRDLGGRGQWPCLCAILDAKAGGWYQTFLDDPFGTIQVGDRQVQVRGLRVRGTRIHDDIERAYAYKYTTPASINYVRGFRTKRRRETTMEFVRP